MDVSASGADAVFRTAFSPEYDLIQIMRGLKSVPGTNSPVDFRLAALTRKGQSDIWHADRVLAFSTDECAPVVINGEDMGGNHALPCCVRVISPGHGLNEPTRAASTGMKAALALRFFALKTTKAFCSFPKTRAQAKPLTPLRTK